MKLNKKFSRILFLSLSMVFAVSFSVSASIKKEKTGFDFEHFVIKDDLNLKDKKRKSGLDLLELYFKKDLNTEEGFEKGKKELINIFDSCVEKQRLCLEEARRSVVMAQECLDDLERLKKEVEYLKYEDFVKGDLSLRCLYKNNGMEKTKDASFKDLDELMKDNKTSTKHRVNLYIVMKYILERANLKKEEIEKVLAGVLSINTCGNPEKIIGGIFLYSTFLETFKKINEILKKLDVKNIEISEEMFEKAKLEIINYYDEIIKKIMPDYKKWSDAFKRSDVFAFAGYDKKIIELLNKEIYDRIYAKAEDKMKREKLKEISDKENKRKAVEWKQALKKGNEAFSEYMEKVKEEKNKQDEFKEKLMREDMILSEKYKKEIEEEYEKEKHKENVLDEEYKKTLKENFLVQKNDLNSFKAVKEAVEKLNYSDVKDLNKDLTFDVF